MKKIAIINGPNLNLLGTREPDIYGNTSFEDYLLVISDKFPKVEFSYYQSNIEGELIQRLQDLDKQVDGIIINPAGYAHTSVAIADSISAISVPVVEVHISNIYSRENYRHTSLTGSKCKGVITGLGLYGYQLAASYLMYQ